MTNRTKLRISLTITALAAANFVAMFIGNTIVGGGPDADLSHDGHYFVSNHGKVREVTPTQYHYLEWHELSVCFTHPLTFVSLLFYALYKKRVDEEDESMLGGDYSAD